MYAGCSGWQHNGVCEALLRAPRRQAHTHRRAGTRGQDGDRRKRPARRPTGNSCRRGSGGSHRQTHCRHQQRHVLTATDDNRPLAYPNANAVVNVGESGAEVGTPPSRLRDLQENNENSYFYRSTPNQPFWVHFEASTGCGRNLTSRCHGAISRESNLTARPMDVGHYRTWPTSIWIGGRSL